MSTVKSAAAGAATTKSAAVSAANKPGSAKNLQVLAQRLWNGFSHKELYGLLSPTTIYQQRLSYYDVRRDELAHLVKVEQDVSALCDGQLQINDAGSLTEVREYDMAQDSTLGLILQLDESPDPEPRRMPSLTDFLDNVDELERYTRLQGDLRLRKAYIFAERQLLRRATMLREQKVDRSWMALWKSSVRHPHNAWSHAFWVKLLVNETLRPRRHSTRILHLLNQMSPADVETLQVVSRFVIGNDIIKSDYFSEDLHTPMFRWLAELNLIEGTVGFEQVLRIASTEESRFVALLRCHDKALLVKSEKLRSLPVEGFRLTSLGREMVGLLDVEADTGYLWALSQYLKQQGLDVELGDYSELAKAC